MTATQFLLEGNNDLRVVSIHNLSSLEALTPDTLGVAIRQADLGFVSVDEFQSPDLASLGEQIGTVASHEAGHLFLPSGHSVDRLNLINEGESLNETLRRDDGGSLEFTDVQKALIRGDIYVSPDAPLEDVESYWAAQGPHGNSGELDGNERSALDNSGNDDVSMEEDAGDIDSTPQDLIDHPDHLDLDGLNVP